MSDPNEGGKAVREARPIQPLLPAAPRCKAVVPLPVHNSEIASRLLRTPHLPVPVWATLPGSAQGDLASRGFDETWFAKSPDPTRMSVLNLYVKLKALGLWHFVECDAGSNSESLTFTVSDVFELKRALRARSDFKNPGAKSSWRSREYQTVGALHFGSFEGWPEDRVQAHIDGRGLFAPHPVLMGVATASLGFLLQMLAHGGTKNTFADPYSIRDDLLDEGFDPATLMGTDPAKPGESASEPKR